MPVRYDRELVQTTVKAMQRIGEIKARRERAFFKHRYGRLFPRTFSMIPIWPFRMAASRDKQRAHRKKTLEATKSSVKLREPISTEVPKEIIKVAIKAKSALLPGEGRSMGMELD